MDPLVLVLDDRSRAHLARALVEHDRWCRRNGVPVPAALGDLLAVLTDGGGRSRPDPATDWTSDVDRSDDAAVLSYAEAADRLRCSARTVGRWAAAGRLVRVGRRVTAASVRALAGVR